MTGASEEFDQSFKTIFKYIQIEHKKTELNFSTLL